MQKKLIFKVITVILIITGLFLIFHFSAEDASVSTKTSNKVTKKILEVFMEDFESKPKAEQKSLIKKTDATIRSLAHFLEYTYMGFLVFLHTSFYNISKRKKALLAYIICALCSLADEIHQIYVPGRSFQFKDLITDSGGILLGMITAFAFTALIKKLTKKSAVS